MKLEFYKCAHCGNVAVKLFDQGVQAKPTALQKSTFQ